MTPTRRDVLKISLAAGAVAATGLSARPALAGMPAQGGSDAGSSTSGPAAAPSTLAAKNVPVPYAAAFRRPPELYPYETGRDADGQLYEKYSLTQKLGKAPIASGLQTTLAGYNGVFPGPSIRVEQGPVRS